jgi:hypothetical protein
LETAKAKPPFTARKQNQKSNPACANRQVEKERAGNIGRRITCCYRLKRAVCENPQRGRQNQQTCTRQSTHPNPKRQERNGKSAPAKNEHNHTAKAISGRKLHAHKTNHELNNSPIYEGSKTIITMLKQLLSLYGVIEKSKGKFETFSLNGDFFIDVYRTQPFQPELYEYFSLPAIFVDYQMAGQGRNSPRTVTLTLHIVVDELPDASNISEQREAGLQRFTYCLLLQSILEGCRLNKTSRLRFISENIIDENVVNYHTQTYEFDVYLDDMLSETERVFGEFERLNIFGSLTKKLPR